MELQLQIKPYGFQLSRPLLTAAGVLQDRRGWLLRLEDSAGRLGWGEVSPLDVEQREVCQDALVKMTRPGVVWTASSLERWLAIAPAAWAFAIGAALAELDGELGSATCGLGDGWSICAGINGWSGSSNRLQRMIGRALRPFLPWYLLLWTSLCRRIPLGAISGRAGRCVDRCWKVTPGLSSAIWCGASLA